MSRRTARRTRRKRARDDPRQLVFEFPREIAAEVPAHEAAAERESRAAAFGIQREPGARKRVALGGESAILEAEKPDMRAVDDYPPLLTVQEAASLLRLRVSTVYRHVSEGKYRKAVRRGKPLRFYRDQLVKEFMR